MWNAGEKFYYCESCKRFHHYEKGHDPVNRKLCFFCDKIQTKKTNIIGDHQRGRTQICDKCLKKHNIVL